MYKLYILALVKKSRISSTHIAFANMLFCRKFAVNSVYRITARGVLEWRLATRVVCAGVCCCGLGWCGVCVGGVRGRGTGGSLGRSVAGPRPWVGASGMPPSDAIIPA